MNNRIEKRMKDLSGLKQKAFIAYITAGFPSLSKTESLVYGLERAGVDVIELGVPFSDPLADGPTIQDASFRALQKGTSLKHVLQMVSRIRKKSQIPIALMTYYNPVYHYGEERFIKEACRAGVDGVIIPDLPPEEAKDLISLAKAKGISTIFFLSPTTSDDRAKRIVRAASGFIYYVSVAGVTGARNALPLSVVKNVRKAKRITDKPVCVGFGISTAKQVRQLSKIADGVIVGSAIVNCIAKNEKSPQLVAKVESYVRSLIKGKV